MKVYQTALKVPAELKSHMGEDTFHKARKYGLDQEKFGIFKAVVMDVALLCMELYIGLIAVLWQLSVRWWINCNGTPKTRSSSAAFLCSYRMY